MPTAAKFKTQSASKTTVKAKTKTTQAITVQQSVEIAQQFIHASISCLTWLREIFPERCFVLQPGEIMSKHATYLSYTKQLQSGRQTDRKSGYEFLIRGKKPVADQFLDQIEHAFSALEKGVLGAFHINVLLDRNKPTDIIESYTFTFSYRMVSGSKVLENAELKDATGNIITASDVRQSLPTFLKHLSLNCRRLPYLPDAKFISVQLDWNEDWDGSWQPQGYQPCDPTKNFGHSGDWQKTTVDPCEQLNTIHHQINLKVSHLARTCATIDGLDDPEEIPANMFYIDGNASSDDVCVAKVKDFTTRVASKENPTSVEPVTQASTQTREGSAMREGLRRLLKPSAPFVSAGETQLLASPAAHGTAPDLAWQLGKLRLAGSTINELRRKTSINQLNSHCCKPGSDTIECECDHNSEKDDMVQCHFCARWQHLTCYGYLNSNDPRLPETHVCYKCLLQKYEAPLLEDLKRIILLRNAVRKIADDGYSTDTKLAMSLNCDSRTAKLIREQLIHEGYLTNKLINRKKKLVIAGEERTRMIQAYFDPTAKIAHHFAVPAAVQVQNSALTTQLTMPPPMTPHPPKILRNTKADADATASKQPLTRQTDDTVDPYTIDEDQTISVDHEARRSLSPSAAKADRQKISSGSYGLSSGVLGKRKTTDGFEPKTPGPANKKFRSSQGWILDTTRTPARSEIISRASSPQTEL